MNPPPPQSQYEIFSARLLAAGFATEAVRVKALARYRPKPGDVPPLAEALLPSATKAELIAVDIASKVSQFLEALTTENGTVAVATALVAVAMVQRKYELMATSAVLSDGASMPGVQTDEWSAKGIELAERLDKLTKALMGDDGRPGIIMEGDG